MSACPNCGKELIRTPGKHGFVWSCPDCGGRAVGVPVLRSTFGNELVASIWSHALNSSSGTGRPCPICARGMKEESISMAGLHLKLGVCLPCEFVWFDTSEYESISPPLPPVHLSEADSKPIPQAEREAIALYQAREMAERLNLENPQPDADWKTVPAIIGLPVEMDSLPLKRMPIATLALAMAITMASLLAFADYKNVVGFFGLVPAELWRHAGLTFFTSFLLHGGIFHLASNLYFLLVVGIPLEEYLGRKRWLALVLLATLVGDALHVAVNPASRLPLIGASGGISGLIAFYVFQFPRANIGFWLRLGWIQIPAWVAFLFWMVLQFIGAIEQISGFSHISALAHLGGTAAGFLLWLVWKKSEATAGPATPNAMTAENPSRHV